MVTESDSLKQLEAQAARLIRSAAHAKFCHDRWLEQAEKEHRQHSAESAARYKQALADATTAYKKVTAQAAVEIRAINQSMGLAAAAWDTLPWLSWTPRLAPPVPQPGGSDIRIGQLAEVGPWHHVTMPALAPIVGRGNLLLSAVGHARNTAVQAIQSLALRLLATILPGQLHFTFIDPLGQGQNAALFMRLAEYDDALVTGKTWTEPQEIEQCLADLVAQIQATTQDYLRDGFATLEEYQARTGLVAEPYRLLVVLDFPANFTESAARRLVEIAQHGPSCGIYTVLLADTEKLAAAGLGLADLEQTATVITWDGQRFAWQHEELRECLLELDTLPPPELLNRIVSDVGQAVSEALQAPIPFERIVSPSKQGWAGSTQQGVRVPLGLAGAGRLQYLALGRGAAQHVLIAGTPEAGKAALLHTLITNLALIYSPDELALYLIDFHNGAGFKPYATTHLSHARVVAIESEREFGLSVLQELDAERQRRHDLLHPRLLLLMDEFQELFAQDDDIAAQATLILERLVQQGHACGIHVLLSSQALASAPPLVRGILDQLQVRIALPCSQADARLILANDNPAAQALVCPDQAIYNAARGALVGNNRFQVATLADPQHEQYLDHIQSLTEKCHYRPPQPQVLFEAQALAEIERNRPLHHLLTSHAPSQGKVRAEIAHPAFTWLGEPTVLGEPVAVTFSRQSGSNLLIVGQDEEAAVGMTAATLISLAIQAPTPVQGGARLGRFYLADVGAMTSPQAAFFDRLADWLPYLVKAVRQHAILAIIAELAAEVDNRLKAEYPISPTTQLKTRAEDPIYLILYGLQRARDLPSAEPPDFSPLEEPLEISSPAQQLITILREGPDVGIHTLAWCDTVANLTDSLDQPALRQFAMRVALQMAPEDSNWLIYAPDASELRPFRALFYNQQEGRMEKFRPYGLPSEPWLAWVKQQVQSRRK